MTSVYNNLTSLPIETVKDWHKKIKNHISNSKISKKDKSYLTYIVDVLKNNLPDGWGGLVYGLFQSETNATSISMKAISFDLLLESNVHTEASEPSTTIGFTFTGDNNTSYYWSSELNEPIDFNKVYRYMD